MKFDCKECGAKESVILAKVARHGAILKILGFLFYVIALLSFAVVGFYAMVAWGAVLLGILGESKFLSVVIGVLSGVAASLLPILIANEFTGSKLKYKCQKCSASFDRKLYDAPLSNIEEE
jgi:hypothetical protein